MSSRRRKGRSHVLRIIREVLSFEPKGNKTNIRSALEYFNHAIKKKSIAFLLSDFIDDNYEKILKIVGRKHDLIGLILRDPREEKIPKAGLIKMQDAETGKIRYIDSSSKTVREHFEQTIKQRDDYRRSLFSTSGLDSIEINAGESYVTPLVKFFKMREKRW